MQPVPFPLDPVEAVGPDSPAQHLSPGERDAAVGKLAASLTRGGTGQRRTLLVVVSDGSRKTGAGLYLPKLVNLLQEQQRLEIRFIVASGLHRRPEAKELGALLGGDLADRFPVLIHDPDNPERLVELGVTRRGTVVQVNRHLLEHDQLLLTGQVGFHYHAGFSGGRKSLVPGLAGRQTITGNHLRTLQADGSRDPGSRAGVLSGNPVHEDMLEAASMVPVATTIINTVMAADGAPEGIWIGEMEQAHREACDYLLRTRAIRLEPRDLLVASAGGHPADINLIQAHKTFEAVFPAVRPGGTVILAAACPEGFGDDEFRQGILAGSEQELAASLLSDYRVYGQTALAWRRKLAVCRLILVSGLDPEQVRETGAEPAGSVAEALEMAAGGPHRPASGWWFGQGARWLVQPAGT